MKRIGTLEIDQDLNFQKQEWRFERTGWVFLLLFLVAAVAGVFGSGPASRKTISAAQGSVRVEYSRALRWQTPQTLEIEMRSGNLEEVALSESLMRAWSIQEVTPSPKEVVATDRETLYRFHGRKGRIVFAYEATRFGRLEGTLRMKNAVVLRLDQWAFP